MPTLKFLIILALLQASATRASKGTAAGFPAVQGFSSAKVSVFEAEVPTASELGATDILVRVEASSVNHLDLLWSILTPAAIWDSAQALWQLSGGFPKILGMDVAGKVVAVGSHVKRFKAGDDAWAMNAAAAVYDGKTLGGLAGHTWAPYVKLREQDAGVMPKRLSYTEAGVLPLVAQTSMAALKKIGAPWKAGATVLILGATGGTGHVAVQLARAMGATTVLATASGSHRDFVQGLGADRLIDYHTEDWWNNSVVPDKSIDAIYDTVLQSGSGDRAYQKLKDGGKYVTLCTGIPVCGAPMPSVLNRLKRPSLSASSLRCTAGSCASGESLDELASMVDAGKLRPHIDVAFPLPEIQNAIDRLLSHHVVGKVALTMNSTSLVFV